MKDVKERIVSWVKWHVWIGFERLYLVFDDADESDSMALAREAGGTAVQIIPNNEHLRTSWALQPSWEGHKALVDSEVQVRQGLNVQYAMTLARREGIVWLLNIDSDELFLPEVCAAAQVGSTRITPMATDAGTMRGAVRPVFESLSASGVETFLFINHEIVPEHVPDLDPARAANSKARGDPFTLLSLFKLSSELVPQTAETRTLVDGWKTKQSLPSSSESHFLYYWHGK